MLIERLSNAFTRVYKNLAMMRSCAMLCDRKWNHIREGRSASGWGVHICWFTAELRSLAGESLLLIREQLLPFGVLWW